MIEFYGELSAECRTKRQKRVDKNFAIIMSSTMGVAMILILVLFFCGVMDLGSLIKYSLIVVVCIAIAIFTIISSPKAVKRVSNMHIKERITIKEYTITSTNSLGVTQIREMSKVKKVIDANYCYYIVFKFGDVSNAWVCQKDLIVEGTLEEFEKLFEGKIVSENK